MNGAGAESSCPAVKRGGGGGGGCAEKSLLKQNREALWFPLIDECGAVKCWSFSGCNRLAELDQESFFVVVFLAAKIQQKDGNTVAHLIKGAET